MSEIHTVLENFKTLQETFTHLQYQNTQLQQQLMEVRNGIEQTNEMIHRLHTKNLTSAPFASAEDSKVHTKINTDKMLCCDLVYNRDTTVITLPKGVHQSTSQNNNAQHMRCSV